MDRARLTEDLSEDLQDAWERLRETAFSHEESREVAETRRQEIKAAMKPHTGPYTADDWRFLNPWPSFLAANSYEWLAE